VSDYATIGPLMPSVKGSRAKLPSRRERARTTQWRMVEAAYGLFCERGYSGTTMADVADAAGVAVQTVYFTFHTKSAVLSRAYDFAVMGKEEPLSPHQQPWYRAMDATPDIAEALHHFVSGVGEIIRRVTPLYVVARGAARSDPEVADVVRFHEDWRTDGYHEVLELLRTKAPLRVGVEAGRANQLLLLYAGMDIYHFLVEVTRWTHDEWVGWTVSTISDQVFLPES